MALKIGIGGNSRSGGGASTADAVSYDNSTSGLQSTTVQGAIDEVGANLGEIDTQVQGHETALHNIPTLTESDWDTLRTAGAVQSSIDTLRDAIFSNKITNLLDTTTITSDKIVNYVYGSLVNKTGCCASDFIKVTAGQRLMQTGYNDYYQSSNASGFCWYDADKKVKEQGAFRFERDTIRIVPDGCEYIRISFPLEYINTVMLLVSDVDFVKPSGYVSYRGYFGGESKIDELYGAKYAILKNSLYGKSFVSIGDSLSNGSIFENELARKANATFLATFQQGGTMSVPSGYSNKSTQDRVLELCASNFTPDYIFIEDVNDRWLSSDWTTGAKEPIGSITDFPFMLSQYIDIDYGYTTKEQAESGFVANFENIVSSVSNKIKGSIIRVKYGENCICRYFVGTTSDEFLNQAKWSESITLYSCYKGIIEKLQNTYKNSRLVWWLPTFWTMFKYENTPQNQTFADGSCNINATISSNNNNYYFMMAKQLRVIVEEVCELYTIQFVNCHKLAGVTPFNSDEFGSSGDIHYYEKTHERMADILYKSVM